MMMFVTLSELPRFFTNALTSMSPWRCHAQLQVGHAPALDDVGAGVNSRAKYLSCHT
jgi:hypothetical protein